MKISGFFNGHDCSFCVLENGVPIIHAEYERYLRLKEPEGDSYGMLLDIVKDIDDIDYFVVAGAAGSRNIFSHKEEWKDSYPERTGRKAPNLTKHFTTPEVKPLLAYPDEEILQVGHHKSHAANAFFSSNFDKSLIITMDGGGREESSKEVPVGKPTFNTIWYGIDNKIYPMDMGFGQPHWESIGQVWTRYTKNVFGLSVGYPYGHSAGTVMAMAAFGDKNVYIDRMNRDIWGTWGQITEEFKDMSDSDVEKARFDVAASLQFWTENIIRSKVERGIKLYKDSTGESPEYLSLAGGVSLNSVVVGKLFDWFDFKDIYVTLTPHDGGIPIGACQYVYHHVLDKPRVKWEDNLSPYLGELYSKDDVDKTLKDNEDKIEISEADDDLVVSLLENQKIVSVFGGGSESGRRALGNRSILADPRSPKMKETINEKVKHRQWFRPFAPSILREEVKNWFQKDVNSPYMTAVIKFKEEVLSKVPAVVHHDGTARLQTVTENDNKWYYNLIKKFQDKTGVPIVLNTSFNDREPIVETPEHAINCFLGTNIDYLYFYEFGILVERK
tara:strand:- start:678 stop:2348 length:1671 start_codon:yes stop_codon:yes gene_type:complete